VLVHLLQALLCTSIQTQTLQQAIQNPSWQKEEYLWIHADKPALSKVNLTILPFNYNKQQTVILSYSQCVDVVQYNPLHQEQEQH
jgi:hypothetical protein